MSAHLTRIAQLHQYADQLGQYNAKSTGWAVARNLYAIQPLNKDATEFEIQFVDRKAWLAFLTPLQQIVQQENWTAKRLVRKVADGVCIHHAYCCVVHVGNKYQKELPLFFEWAQRLLSHMK
jgi:hypothetical protein